MIRQFRDPRLSLWQSAVDVVIGRQRPDANRPDTDNPFVDAATELSARLDRGEALSTLESALAPVSGIGDAILRCARLAMLLAEAKATGRVRDVERYQEELDVEFGQCDPDWLEVAEEYARNLVLHMGEVPYRRHQALTDFVIEGRLPANARLALVGDWGTGQPEARNLIEQIGRKSPDALIHLGDIYYSGTAFEVERYFLAPLQAAIDPERTACFSLSGNHDMYSGGLAYYNELLGALGQPASHFCLRNENWQFVAMDTGLRDRIPGGGPTFLERTELDWVADKIQNAGGRQTVLLSHHPLFSAYEQIGDGFYNERLYAQVAPLLDSVAAWFWGHEHRLVVYEPFEHVQPGLKRGRCLGCGAVPVGVDEEPAAPLFPQVPFNPEARLGRGDAFYHHAYAILDLEGAAARISYYQDTDENVPLFQEEIVSRAAAGRGSLAAP